jgi:hypothetical protein
MHAKEIEAIGEGVLDFKIESDINSLARVDHENLTYWS